MAEQKTYYMHLMDGQPAAWDKKEEYLYFISKSITSKEMCKSLKTLRRQQERQKQLNTEQWNHQTTYGYIIVRA